MAAARAAFVANHTRLWVAVTASRAASPDTAVRHSGLSAGVERRLGRALLSASMGPRRDRTATQRVVHVTERLIPEKVFALPGTTVMQETTFVADTITRPANRRIPDFGLALSWAHHALAIDAAAHFALAGELRRTDPLARLEVRYDVTPRLSAIAGVVSRSAVRSADIRAGQVATIGLRIHGRLAGREPNAPARGAVASDFRAISDAGGLVHLAVRAAGATHVEIAGDFTHWNPIALQRAKDGWWRASVRAGRGIHQLSVRVDGRNWIAPPGLRPIQDEFGATVGLLVVP